MGTKLIVRILFINFSYIEEISFTVCMHLISIYQYMLEAKSYWGFMYSLHDNYFSVIWASIYGS